MKALTLVCLVCLSSMLAAAQAFKLPKLPSMGRTEAAFIPAGYEVLDEGRVVGDLNQDGRPDIALALRATAETASDGEEYPERLLVLLFATPAGYRLAAQSNKIVLCKECGGIYGDPFAGLTIFKGVLSVDHYGGSSWRWSLTHKFRYQQGAFYLIGETTSSGRNFGECPGLDGPPGWEYHDTNLVTGDYEVKKVSEECKLLVSKRGRNKPAPLRRLTDYTVEP